MTYAAIVPIIGSLASYALGSFVTARIYRRKLKESRVDADKGWNWATEGWALAAKWRKVYFKLLDSQ